MIALSILPVSPASILPSASACFSKLVLGFLLRRFFPPVFAFFRPRLPANVRFFFRFSSSSSGLFGGGGGFFGCLFCVHIFCDSKPRRKIKGNLRAQDDAENTHQGQTFATISRMRISTSTHFALFPTMCIMTSVFMFSQARCNGCLFFTKQAVRNRSVHYKHLEDCMCTVNSPARRRGSQRPERRISLC